MKAAVGSLPMLQQKLKKLKTASAQLAQVTNRLFVTLEGRGVLRTAPESFNLSANSTTKDELSPEYIRTFRTVDFCGRILLSRFEVLQLPYMIQTQQRERMISGRSVSGLPNLHKFPSNAPKGRPLAVYS